MRLTVPFFSICSYIIIFIAITLIKPPPDDPLKVLASQSQNILKEYVQKDQILKKSNLKEDKREAIISL